MNRSKKTAVSEQKSLGREGLAIMKAGRWLFCWLIDRGGMMLLLSGFFLLVAWENLDPSRDLISRGELITWPFRIGNAVLSLAIFLFLIWLYWKNRTVERPDSHK